MLRIKLSRVGKKKHPQYRILVMEKSKDPWGNFLENVGFYDSCTEPSTIEFKEDRIKYWISKGAQPTDTIHNLLVDAGIVSAKKRNVSALGKKAKEAVKKAEEDAKKPKEEAKPAEETPAEAPVEAPKEEKADAPAEEKAQ